MRSRLAVSMLAVSITLAAGGVGAAASVRAAASAATPRTEHPGPASAVPWTLVGKGWVLATWEPTDVARSPRGATKNELVLLSPSGARYGLAVLPADAELVAWSGDGERALLDEGASQTTLKVLNLRSGSTEQGFTLPDPSSVFYESAGFTRPDGFALMVGTQTDDHQLVTRYAFDGARQLNYPTSFGTLGASTGSWLSSSSGTELVLGARKGLAIVANDGRVLRLLPSPHAAYCVPLRWWSAAVILARCGSLPRLYEFSAGGGAPRALTRRPVPPDDGDLAAWHVGAAAYVQVASACGYIYLAKLKGDAPELVHVPGVPTSHSVLVDGVSGTSIVLQASVACQSGSSLLDYTPSNDRARVVLGPPATKGSVGEAVVYPTPLG